MRQSLEETLQEDGDTDIAFAENAERSSLWRYRLEVFGEELYSGARSLIGKAGQALVTIPLYLIGGLFPAEAQRDLERHHKRFNAVHATRVSLLTSAAAYGYATYALVAQAGRTGSMALAAAAMLVGMVGIFETIARAGVSTLPYSDPCGSIPGWLLYQPYRAAEGTVRSASKWLRGIDRKARERYDGDMK